MPMRLVGELSGICAAAQWADLPDKYGSYKTVHRRSQKWSKQEFFES
jgi:transposase